MVCRGRPRAGHPKAVACRQRSGSRLPLRRAARLDQGRGKPIVCGVVDGRHRRSVASRRQVGAGRHTPRRARDRATRCSDLRRTSRRHHPQCLAGSRRRQSQGDDPPRLPPARRSRRGTPAQDAGGTTGKHDLHRPRRSGHARAGHDRVQMRADPVRRPVHRPRGRAAGRLGDRPGDRRGGGAGSRGQPHASSRAGHRSRIDGPPRCLRRSGHTSRRHGHDRRQAVRGVARPHRCRCRASSRSPRRRARRARGAGCGNRRARKRSQATGRPPQARTATTPSRRAAKRARRACRHLP